MRVEIDYAGGMFPVLARLSSDKGVIIGEVEDPTAGEVIVLRRAAMFDAMYELLERISADLHHLSGDTLSMVSWGDRVDELLRVGAALSFETEEGGERE